MEDIQDKKVMRVVVSGRHPHNVMASLGLPKTVICLTKWVSFEYLQNCPEDNYAAENIY